MARHSNRESSVPETYFLSVQERKATRTRRLLGYGVIALAVVGAVVLGLSPRTFGARDAPAGLGLAVGLVAAYRLVRLFTAVRQHDQAVARK